MARPLSALRPGLFSLLLAGLLLRILVPAGFMVSGQGLVPCDGFGPAAAAPAHHGGRPAKHDPARHADGPCPYAALAAPAVPPAPPAFEPGEHAALPPPTPQSRRVVAFVSPAAPPPPATGPPAFS